MTQRFSRVTVSPATAAKWLKDFNYADNRSISRGDVIYLARQMSKDLWRDNGEPLIFDAEGHLLDGQHRLSAVVLSGVTITFDVRRGVDTESFTTIDQGRARTSAQVLRMSGVRNASVVSALCRMVYQWEAHGSVFVGRKVSPDELMLILETYEQDVHEAADTAVKLRPSKLPLQGSIAAFAYFLFAQVSKRKADVFFDVLRDGVADHKHHPAITLRNRLFSEAVASARRTLPKNAVWGLMIRAWNHHHAGKTVTQLQIKADGSGGFKIPAIRGAGKHQCRQGGKKWHGADPAPKVTTGKAAKA